MRVYEAASGGMGFAPLAYKVGEPGRAFLTGGEPTTINIPNPEEVYKSGYNGHDNPLLFYQLSDELSIGIFSVISYPTTDVGIVYNYTISIYDISTGTPTIPESTIPISSSADDAFEMKHTKLPSSGSTFHVKKSASQMALKAIVTPEGRFALSLQCTADNYYSARYGQQEYYPLDPNQLVEYADSKDSFANYFTFSPFFWIVKWVDGEIEPLEDRDTTDRPDPSYPDPSKPGGDDSGSTPLPPLPDKGAIASGFVTVYKPSSSEMQQFAGYLWGDKILKNLPKMVTDPMDLIISLNISPIEPVGVAQRLVHLGPINTEVYMTYIASEYTTFNCGSLEVPEKFNNFLDIANTEVSLFLPFVGIIKLNPSEVMGATLNIQYYVNVLTGAGVVMVVVNRNNMSAILYKNSINAIYPIQITAKNWSQVYSAAVGTVKNLVTGNLGGAIDSISKARVNYEKSGTITGGSSMMDYRTPYLIIERPIPSIPDNLNNLKGRPSNYTDTLGNLSGYTEIDSVIADNLSCHADEKDKIINLLKSGVYL